MRMEIQNLNLEIQTKSEDTVMTKKKKAILYCRSACIDNNYALNVQEQMLRKYAKSQGYEIVEVIK